MHIRCPHCHQPIELVDDDPSGDMTCESCGSAFNLASDSETVADDGSHAKSIAHFTLVDCLGQGAFGSVWKALDRELERTVAVKIPRKDQLNSTEAEQFLREARTAAQLRHPNIVPVHEVGREDDTLYIVSDFIEGLSLADWLTGQQLTTREAAELCVTIAEALHHAHEAGVVHRDLKPANIMLDDEGRPHIMDFGLARREAGEITMTIEGKLLGTPAYMPPEQARGEGHHADRRSDLYSLGVILFELLTNEKPFRGNQRMLLHQVLHEEPPSPRKLNQSVPRDLETITLKCLQKDPVRRYQTTAELATDLNHWLAGEPITARPVSAIERSWRWCRRNPALAGMWSVAMLFLCTLGIGGTLFAIQQAKSATEQTKLRRNAERIAYNSDMLLVQRDWNTANMDHLRALLDRHRDRDDLKGFEWSYWDRLAHSDLLTFKGHSIGFVDVTFCADGTRFATSGSGTVDVWDVATGQLKLTLNGCIQASFSPDGTHLATGSADGAVQLWEAVSGRLTFTLKGHTGFVLSVLFSPDGKRLVSTSEDGIVKVWDVATGQEALSLIGHVGASFSPNGTRLVSTSEDGTVKVWDATTGEETLTLTGHTSKVTHVAFSQNGSRLLSTGEDATVKVWDVVAGQETVTLIGHTAALFSPDATRIATHGDGTVKVWDTDTGKELLTVSGGHIGFVDNLAFSPDGTWLASAGADKTVKVWDVATGQEIHTFKGHTSFVDGVAFSSDGTRLVSTSIDRTVKVWDSATGQETLTLKGHTEVVGGVAFTADGKRVASGSADGTVKVWDAATGLETHTIRNAGFVLGLAFSPDGTRLAFVGPPEFGQPGRLEVWDWATRRKTLTLNGLSLLARSVAFSPDGRRLASGTGDETKVWNATSGLEILTFKGHSGAVLGVSFGPDGARIASASEDKTVKIWDAHSGHEMLTLRGHTKGVRSVSFSPDGTRLASASDDRTVKVWDVGTGDETYTLIHSE